MKETAYAKVNLALHVRRRRDDGYHEIETLFAFVDAGDVLEARAAPRDELRTVGEFASELTDQFGNIVSKALSALPHGPGWTVTLEKNLPVAAGLGGGSADAGAVFRMVEREYGLPADWHERAARLGADVPACVRSEACVGRGTGTELESIQNDWAGLPVLLVNPRTAVSTASIFAIWNGKDSGPLQGETVWEIAQFNGNDLEGIAMFQHASIIEVLNALGKTNYLVRRMSGSGATCYAVYDDIAEREAAANQIALDRPDWWQMSGRLR